MTPTAGMSTRTVQRYREDEINSLSPIELTIKVLEVGISACAKRDRDRASRALVELIASLNFEHSEIAGGLYQLYDYCLRCVGKNNFEMPETILKELRDTWVQALAQKDAPPASPRA